MARRFKVCIAQSTALRVQAETAGPALDPSAHPEAVQQHAPLRVLLDIADPLADDGRDLEVVRGHDRRFGEDRTLGSLPPRGRRRRVPRACVLGRSQTSVDALATEPVRYGRVARA